MYANNFGFSSLESLNFNGLSSLSVVGNNWMHSTNHGFGKLESLNFDGLSSLSSVGSGWLYAETYAFSSVTSIDFSRLSSLESVGNGWMYTESGDGTNGFASLQTLFVGDVNLNNINITNSENFCAGLPSTGAISDNSFENFSMGTGTT